MMKRFIAGAALLAVAAPIPVVAATTTAATAPVSAEQQRLALELARAMNSEELTRAQISKMLDDTLPKTFGATPEFAAMERDNPGITKAVIEAMRPIILNGTLTRLPTLWERLVPIYTRMFSVAELHTLLDFYTSPAGVRVIKAMGEGADYSRLLGDMIVNNSKTVTSDGVSAGVQSGVAQVIRTATPEDIKAMQALVATSAGKKLPMLNQEVQAASVAWGNEPVPELDAQVESAVKDAVIKFLGKPAQ